MARKDVSADVFAAMNQGPPRQGPPQGSFGGNRPPDNSMMGRPSEHHSALNTGGSFPPQPPMQQQQQFSEPRPEANESMILDGRTRRFAITIPWASYCMLRPYVSPSVAAAETGRIVGRAQQVQADVLVPSVLHTLDKAALPRSLTPKAINVSSLPPDAFVAFFFVVRLLDGRTLRSFHRFSEVKEFTASMEKVLGAPLVEVGWFPWRNVHHSLVNVDARRRKLEAYMSMLFTHNQALQSHPLTLHFFARSGAADLEVGVAMPPPPCISSGSDGNGNFGKRFGADGSDNAGGGGGGGGSGEPVSGRVVVSPSKRLVTVVVDVDLLASRSNPRGCAAMAAELCVSKLRDATHGDDTSELRVISLEGVAPPSVATAVGQALEAELGSARGSALFCDEPNLQLLRALHHFDQAGEGLCSALSMGIVLGKLGVHIPPEVTSDLLMQSFVDGETSVLWHGKGKQQQQQQQRQQPPRLVDYHTFLALVLARTQPPFLARPGDAQALAAASRAASGNFAGAQQGAQAEAVDVSTLAPIDHRPLGLKRYSIVVMVSAHAGGAVAAAGGKAGGGGMLGGVGGGAGGGGVMMGEGSPAFLDFKTKGERGLEVTIHKLKWPKAAAAIHKAVGINAAALDNSAAGVGVGGGCGGGGGGGAGGGNSNHNGGVGCGGGGGGLVGGGCGPSAGAGGNPFGDVNKPFLVAKQRLIRVTDGWTKLVWFKQGFKGAVAKVGRAFTNSGLARPSEQPGAGTFDLLQVTQVRVVENPKSGLGRWFLFKKEGNGEGGGVGRGVSGGASFSARPTSPGSASFSSSAPGGGGETYDRYLAFVGLRESLYVEASSRQERDWLVSGFRQLLFGAEGRARARGFAHGRALESGHLDAQSLAAIGAASGAAAAHASHASVAAASASAMAYTDSTNGCGGGGCGGGGGGGGYSRPPPPPSANALYVFNLFDGDGNGVLDREEATKALVWAGFVDGGPSGRSQLESLFQRFDADGSGDLDVNEFAQLMVACEHGEAPTAEASASSNHGGGRGGGVGGSDGTGGGSSSQVGDKALLESFRRLDASGGGMLGEFEVGQWLGSVGIQIEEQQVRELFQKADVNKDGKLTFAEFSKLTAVVQQRQRA